jgi:hypothetical protein
MNLVNLFVGLFLLTLERRLFWLFMGCVGFAAGYSYAQQLWGIQTGLMILVFVALTITGVLFQAGLMPRERFSGRTPATRATSLEGTITQNVRSTICT